MSRILAIDYGTKRVGIAVTDREQTIANGLTTVHSKDIITFLNNYFSEEQVECIVIGEPKQMNNQPSALAKTVDDFVINLRKKFPGIPVVRMDERFTTVLAARTMLEGGLRKKARRNKKLLDEISATIILQSYLEKRMNNTINNNTN